MTQDEPCVRCSKPLNPTCNFFISEIGKDLLWQCSCGQKYDVEHECFDDFCLEFLTPVNTREQ